MTLPPFNDITAVILAGGKSRRMGQDKALLPVQGKPLFERVLEPLQDCFTQLLVIGDRPKRFEQYHLTVLPDLFPGSSLGGLYTGLQHATTETVFVTSCDLPFPNRAIIRHICQLKEGYDVVVPYSPLGIEPLFACYRKSGLTAMRAQLEQGVFTISTVFSKLQTRHVPWHELQALDPAGTAFLNLNTPADLAALEP